MKLELKHLAPYLPYGLKIQGKKHRDTYNKKPIYQLNGLAIQECGNPQYEFFNDEELFFAMANNKEWKPILRPLSDISEDNLKEVKKGLLVDFKYIDKDGIQSIHFPKGNICITSIRYEVVDECPLGFYNYLLENHFDVFGLIPKGLAIDINTINKQ